ncbi:MAG: hypothetical protein HQL84_05530 [Magnetococcales bacterium]|nr:hypothetical protein [Magnetococcales bacterium]MBF0149493.1 hypothetical protein [Magnetococcales bacterium]MBF0173805.1 hypothetical protein [Magnetococcales bacterium]MBF0347816.1 hypothetical protein [Magnetococcales bacterium]MBF0630845.1 hypothetical protein [Magnetococcales bacterium]
MYWTREKPKEPGWYWWQPMPNYTEAVLVKQGFAYQVGVAQGKQVGLMAGHWWGPLQAPVRKPGE